MILIKMLILTMFIILLVITILHAAHYMKSKRDGISKLNPHATELVIDAIEDAVIVLDDKLQFIKANAAFFKIFPKAVGITRGVGIDILDRWPKELCGLNELKVLNTHLEFKLDNDNRYYNAKVSKVKNDKGNDIGWTILIEDTSEVKELMCKLERVAYIDGLTGIFNRSHFMDEAARRFERARRNNDQCSVIIFDLDFFKKVNDTYGHAAGDAVLKAIANNIQKKLRPYDLFGRYGGEEFIIFIESGESAAIRLAERVRQEVSSRLYPYKDVLIRCTISCGVSGNAESLNSVISNADIALYRAKRNGRNRVVLYSDNKLMSELTLAVEESFRGFNLFYQPIFSARSNGCIGAECLLRWQTSYGEIIMPDSFIPILEKFGLMAKTEKWVLSTACHQCKNWMKERDKFYIHVNLSKALIINGSMYNDVMEAVEKSGVDAGNIVLEFKDDLDLSTSSEAAEMFLMLMKKNVHIAIDKFGNGHSPLNRFRNLCVDELKIDKSFITDIENDVSARNLLSNIIGMCKSLNRNVCILGVESDWQRDFLCKQEVDKLQGYLLGKPVCFSEFKEKYMGSS